MLVGDDFASVPNALATTRCWTLREGGEGSTWRANSYEVRGLRVSSSAVRDALALGAWTTVALLGRPYSISGHVVHGRKLGRNWARGPTGFAR